MSGDPRGFDLTGDGERWEAAGGDEISEAHEFPTVLYEKWVEVLGAAAEALEWEPAQVGGWGVRAGWMGAGGGGGGQGERGRQADKQRDLRCHLSGQPASGQELPLLTDPSATPFHPLYYFSVGGAVAQPSEVGARPAARRPRLWQRHRHGRAAGHQ